MFYLFESKKYFGRGEEEGDEVNIKQYDRVLLTDGNEAVIVEIFAPGRAFLADIEKDDDIYTEDVTIDEIQKVL